MATKLSSQLCTESNELLKGNLFQNLFVLLFSREKNPSTAFLSPEDHGDLHNLGVLLVYAVAALIPKVWDWYVKRREGEATKISHSMYATSTSISFATSPCLLSLVINSAFRTLACARNKP